MGRFYNMFGWLKKKHEVDEHKLMISLVHEIPACDRLVCPRCIKIFNGAIIGTSEGPRRYAICTACSLEFCRECYLDYHGYTSCAAAWDTGKTLLRRNSIEYHALSDVTKRALETKWRRLAKEKEEKMERENKGKKKINEILIEMKSSVMDKDELERRRIQMLLKHCIMPLENEMEILHERLQKGELVESMYQKECYRVSQQISRIFQQYNEAMIGIMRKRQEEMEMKRRRSDHGGAYYKTREGDVIERAKHLMRQLLTEQISIQEYEQRTEKMYLELEQMIDAGEISKERCKWIIQRLISTRKDWIN